VRWADQAAAEAAARGTAALAASKGLELSPYILDDFARALAESGLAGEERAAKLLYIIVTSRLLQRPVSAAIKGPSGGGKSYLTERVLAFFPESACYALSAMSERALAYSEEPLAHRMLVIYEAAGLAGDFATYLVRSLLSEGCVRYETVERTPDGLRPRLIERAGPTGLLVTTTRVGLHPENATRLLSIPANATPDQTKAVLLALAREGTAAVDLAPWHALQVWLEGAEHRVTIPYAQLLAEAIPPVAVRLRRDFGAVLNLIRAHAVLHQAIRRRDAEGRIEAHVEDYEAVRVLVGDLVADGVEAAVPATVRETVRVVAQLAALAPEGEASVVAVARELKLDKSSALRRVRVAIERGYIRNLEDRKGRPARLVPGDALPGDVAVLPVLAEVPERDHPDGCRVAAIPGGIAPLPPTEVATWRR
jgi:hypothetical protein